MSDIHLVAAFFEDVGADIVLSDAAYIKHLAAFFVIEQFHLVEQVDAWKHLIYLNFGVCRSHLGDDIVGLLNRHWSFNSHTSEGVKHLVDQTLVGAIFVVDCPCLAITCQNDLIAALVGKKELCNRGSVINGEIGCITA